MNIPTQSGQGSTASTDYQSMYSARAGKSTFEQALAQTQSSSFSLTTAEGDRVTLSSLSQNYQYTHAIGWFNPTSSGLTVAGSSATAEAMGFSVQGDLNEQELADITRLVGELTSIASDFFSGDYDGALTRAMDFGDLSMGSVSSLSASFSSETVIQTRISSYEALPAKADDLSDALGTDASEELKYAELLKARWQQILKVLDAMQARELDGLFTRREEPQPVAAQDVPDAARKEEQPLASAPPPAAKEAEPATQAAPAAERVARKMLARMEEFLGTHPKLSPFAGPLAAASMEKAANKSEQPLPDMAKAFGALRNAVRNRLPQGFPPPEPPPAAPAPPATTA